MAKGFKTGGRKPHTPNKINKALKDMVLSALHNVGGEGYLETQAGANPAAFLTLVGKLLPKDVNANVTGQIDLRKFIQSLGEPD